ncbi:hypothetical protein OF83DRAFT_1112585 [Amylostereum chailletii]|nr:hypothetical protein OF83DRAFT_1112585 [Amylostereum chailletii]
MNFPDHGFPHGYFIIRSVASDRLLDIAGDTSDDGAELHLWPEKEKSLVESFRDPEANNQVFYIDTAGALCVRSAGHAVDIEDGCPVLRHRRPVSPPYPNAYSHPLPQFHYSSLTGHITVTFESDPAYPDYPNPNGPWRYKTYYLTSIPERRPRTLMDDASDAIATAFRSPMSLFSIPNLQNIQMPTSPSAPQETFDLREDEIEEQDRAEENEADDSPEKGRKARVVGTREEEDKRLGESAKRRRLWEVLPLRRAPAKTT